MLNSDISFWILFTDAETDVVDGHERTPPALLELIEQLLADIPPLPFSSPLRVPSPVQQRVKKIK